MSRVPRPFLVLGFGSTHAALDAEALLTDLGIDVVPVPAPKELGALCGIVLRLEMADESRALRYLADADMAPKSQLVIDDV
jgi:ribosomal protein L7Ae-like RNA K-turn-binding protein